MSGPLWLFLFLFVLPLVSPLSIDNANCPETQACLQMNYCKDEIESISYLESEVNKNFTCEDSQKPTWIVFRIEPKSVYEWRLEIFSNREGKEFTVSFDNEMLEISKNNDTFSGILNDMIEIKRERFIQSNESDDTFESIKLTSTKSLYNQLMKGNISSPNSEGVVLKAKEKLQLKMKIYDILHPCDVTKLIDGCETVKNCTKISGNAYKAKCDTKFWVNHGSSIQPDYRRVGSIVCKIGSWSENRKSLIGKRETICTALNPNYNICDPQEELKKCLNDECNLIAKETAKNRHIMCSNEAMNIWIFSDRRAKYTNFIKHTNFIYCKYNEWKYNGYPEPVWDTDKDRFLCSEKEPAFCDILKLNDRCEAGMEKCTKMTANYTQALCNETIWVNNGSAEQSNFLKVERIDCKKQEWIAVIGNQLTNEPLGKRGTLCSNHPTQKEEINSDSDFCNQRHLNEYCDGDCTLKMVHHNATCPTKLWIDTGNSAFTRHWLSINQIKCDNGKWKWKHDSGTDWNSIGKMEVACSATSLPQTKPLLYGTVGGSIGLLIIILVVAIILYKRRTKVPVAVTNTEKSKTNTEKSTDKGKFNEIKKNCIDKCDIVSHLGSLVLGVAVDPSKAEMKTWNWPEETEGTQIGSRPEAKTPPSRPDQNVANSPQPEALTETPDKNVKDTKFINVTESPTKNSSRKARRSKGKTVNVTESPKNSSRKARRPKGKTGDVPESPKNSSRKIHRPKGKTIDVNVSPKRKSDRPKKGKTTREDVLW